MDDDTLAPIACHLWIRPLRRYQGRMTEYHPEIDLSTSPEMELGPPFEGDFFAAPQSRQRIVQ